MERSTRAASVTGAGVPVGLGWLRLVGFAGVLGLAGVVGAEVEVVVGCGDGVGLVRARVDGDVQPAAVRAANAPATT
jgi:hypothetical protein